MCTFFLVFAFRDARFLSGLYGRFSYIVRFVVREVMRHGVVAASWLWEFLACKAGERVHGNEAPGDAWMNGR